MDRQATVLPKTPSMRLDGRRALITGAGRGIGFASAVALAEAGAEVTLVARNTAEIISASNLIQAQYRSARAATLDVTDTPAVEQFFKSEAPFDILVNSAGTNRPNSMWDVSQGDFDAVHNLNVKSVFFVTVACTRRMIEAKLAGSVIHIGSQLGHVGSAGRSIYCASKWALEGLSKSFALELAPHGIRSNVVAPTYIETELTRPYFEDKDFLANVLERIKIGRVGQITDLMAPILLLASNASSMITGSSLLIDGGWTAE